MKLGIYGGSFDPIHVGHLLLAEACRETCELDEVWFVPANVPPHKLDRNLAGGKHRLEMLALATGGHPNFRVCDMELTRGGTSFTADTLAELSEQRPGDQLFLIMGPDSLREFSTWKNPREICRLAVPIVVHIGDATEVDWTHVQSFADEERMKEIRAASTTIPHIEISSTDIRERRRGGKSIRYRVPAAVGQYIDQHKLYE